ncbi:MAG: hypothetical protein Kow0077_24670 [Anaerolineae bacterium]
MSSTEQGANSPTKQRGANPTLEQWRVTIQRVRPQLIGVVVFTLGLVLGLVWAYGVAPTIWINAEPVHLHQSFKEEWVKLVADQYSLFGQQGRDHAADLLNRVGNAQAIIDKLVSENSNNPTLQARLNALREFAAGADNPELRKIQYGGLQTLNPAILVVGVLVLGSILVILWGMYAMAISMIVKGLLPSRRRTETSAAMSEASRLEQERRRIMQETAQRVDSTPPAAVHGDERLVKKFVSTYLMGDDYYDDSFSIEDESGGFLGETGAGISETISVGTPKKVTAVEVWLFDKNDIKTVTKVVMSEHAYNNEAMRTKLAPKGEAVLAQPGVPIILESATLRVVATIVNLEYGPEPTPAPNSYFENLTFDLAVYAKPGATSEPGTAIGDSITQNLPPY